MTSGGCQCGAVRYRLTGAPRDTYACHCNECRKQSASAFGISVLVDHSDLLVLQGTTKTWTRPTDSGATLACHFCTDCGTRLWHISSSDPATVSIKGGSLDQMPDYSSLRHIWVGQKLTGLPLPIGAICFEKEPT